jgi:hypothetical protein
MKMVVVAVVLPMVVDAAAACVTVVTVLLSKFLVPSRMLYIFCSKLYLFCPNVLWSLIAAKAPSVGYVDECLEGQIRLGGHCVPRVKLLE